MNKIEIAPGIMIYKDVIDGYESIITDIEDAVLLKSASWSPAGVKSGEQNGVDTTKRDTLTIGIPYSATPQEDLSSPSKAFYSILGGIFFNAFDPVEKDYARTYMIDLPWHDTYGILKYGVGQKFVNHIDDHTDYHRRVSFVYYLNDNYTGGEINFPRFDISYKPKANEMLVFPSTYVYNHSVSEVTEGERYAVVSWLR
jgi:hypothetical protein